MKRKKKKLHNRNVLVIGDVHEPATHPGYMAFCKHLRNSFQTNETVIIGDICDNQAISFHASNPECPGPSDEYELTAEKIAKWHKEFPDAYVTIGNHDARVIRLAESMNIPSRYLRDYSEVWNTPTWKWVDEIFIDDVMYFHGINRSGKTPAFNAMNDMLCSVVMGHCHSSAGVLWRANTHKRTFGMDTGCGIDVDAFQFAYGKHMRARPILAAGVVLCGTPQHFIMPCGRGEKFHKARFMKG
ncbi:MAG TPA: metallophosphoesterase [Patescibacteria group bacterium]|nr:metallophosphoesterase [Patescibacteria group bacterium]